MVLHHGRNACRCSYTGSRLPDTLSRRRRPSRGCKYEWGGRAGWWDDWLHARAPVQVSQPVWRKCCVCVYVRLLCVHIDIYCVKVCVFDFCVFLCVCVSRLPWVCMFVTEVAVMLVVVLIIIVYNKQHNLVWSSTSITVATIKTPEWKMYPSVDVQCLDKDWGWR